MADHRFPLEKNSGLKRAINEYLRESFHGGMLPGRVRRSGGCTIDKSWSLSYHLGMAIVVGIDRVVFGAECA